MNLSRRSVLKVTAAASAMSILPKGLFGADNEMVRKVPIGLQLYSVRGECEKDLPRVLAAVKQMGYKGVEFAGYYGRNAAQLKTLLDDNGLVCCGTHTGLETLTGDNLKKTVEFHKTIGNKFLICPYIPENRFATVEKCKELAQFFNELAEKVKGDGMRAGYHAHGGDFKKIGDETHWDLLFSNTAQDVVMQLDIGNCLDGGGDPYAILKKFPGRAATIHIKEHGGKAGAPIGEGEIRWKEIWELCEKPGKTEWYIVEHESGAKPLESVKECIDNLRNMGKC